MPRCVVYSDVCPAPRSTGPPEGFRYHPDFLSETEEHALIDAITTLEFQRCACMGWRLNAGACILDGSMGMSRGA